MLPKELERKLNANGYSCDTEFARNLAPCLANKPIAGAFLRGTAGTGKTYLPEKLAKITKKTLLTFQCVADTRFEDLIIKFIPDEATTSGIKGYDSILVQAVKASKENKVILLIDEWDKTRPTADAYLLQFLQSGEVESNGFKGKATIKNLTVFIGMNDERDISEALLRRLPKLDFKPLHVQTVMRALESTHKNHKFLPNMGALYLKCLEARLSKPATIQELRQMLDAITMLGEEADWNQLVYSFITKTTENHLLLKEVEDSENTYYETQTLTPQLNTKSYEVIREPEPEPEPEKKAIMPSLFNLLPSFFRKKEEVIDEIPKNPKGLLKLDRETYNFAVQVSGGEVTDHHQKLGKATISDEVIYLHKPIKLTDIENYKEIFGKEGEIIFYIEHVSLEELMVLQKEKAIKVYEATKTRILFSHADQDAIWTARDSRIDIVVNMKKISGEHHVLSFSQSLLRKFARMKDKETPITESKSKLDSKLDALKIGKWQVFNKTTDALSEELKVNPNMGDFNEQEAIMDTVFLRRYSEDHFAIITAGHLFSRSSPAGVDIITRFFYKAMSNDKASSDSNRALKDYNMCYLLTNTYMRQTLYSVEVKVVNGDRYISTKDHSTYTSLKDGMKARTLTCDVYYGEIKKMEDDYQASVKEVLIGGLKK